MWVRHSVEASKGSLNQVAVEGEGDGGGCEVPKGYQGRHQKETPEEVWERPDEGGGYEGGPSVNVHLLCPFSFIVGDRRGGSFSLVISFVRRPVG